MGDDIGWFNIGAYHQGIMAGRTPNLDKLAAEGMRFTDYYAEASCTAGRANFITGELPIRTGMTTVGQAGSPIGMPEQAPTIATALKSMGYATGQFGKNHLGDLNQFLPTAHGFDEFFGYLYHLDAMEDPSHRNYPKNLIATVGPRNMVHSWATTTDDPTVMPRWGKIGKQKIEDAGTLYPKRMETVDDEIRDNAFKFLDKAKADGKPFFLWLNPTRMHVVTHLSEKYEALRNSENGWSIQEAGMAQLDDDVGLLMKKLKDMGVDDNTIVVFTTDNGAENFTWPDGGNTPFAGGKGTAMEGGFRVPALLRWPGTERVDAQIGGVQHHVVDLIHFRHDRHGARRGMHSALRFRGRYALHAMRAGFEFQHRVCALSDDARDDLLVAAHLAGTFSDHFHLPALALGETRVHAEQVAGKQRSLVAAGSGAYFQEHAALVVGVFGQQLLL